MNNMNKSSSNPLSCTWLKKRAEMYSNLAESGLSTLNKVGFHFSDPYDCWVCVTISIDGKEVVKARLSNVLWGDPVRELIDWAESCTGGTSNYCFPFGEGTDYIFHYENLLFNQREKNGKWLATGIFSLYIKGLETSSLNTHYVIQKSFWRAFIMRFSILPRGRRLMRTLWMTGRGIYMAVWGIRIVKKIENRRKR